MAHGPNEVGTLVVSSVRLNIATKRLRQALPKWKVEKGSAVHARRAEPRMNCLGRAQGYVFQTWSRAHLDIADRRPLRPTGMTILNGSTVSRTGRPDANWAKGIWARS